MSDITDYRKLQFEKLIGGNRTYTIVINDGQGNKTHHLNIDALELQAIKKVLTGDK